MPEKPGQSRDAHANLLHLGRASEKLRVVSVSRAPGPDRRAGATAARVYAL